MRMPPMAEQQATESQFQIHKLYIKDVSFQIPNPKDIFKAEWAPELNVEVQNSTKALAEENTHESVLTVKCSVKSGGKEAFTCEVQQAGIFSITGLEEAQLKHTLGAYAPSVLYPYLREVVTDLVMKGGFPQLSLAPINFELLYQQEQEQKSKAEA